MKTIEPYKQHAARLVLNRNQKISEVAQRYAVSPSTIRRWLDQYSDLQLEERWVQLNMNDWNEVIGWIRNGSSSANQLADKIEDMLS